MDRSLFQKTFFRDHKKSGSVLGKWGRTNMLLPACLQKLVGEVFLFSSVAGTSWGKVGGNVAGFSDAQNKGLKQSGKFGAFLVRIWKFVTRKDHLCQNRCFQPKNEILKPTPKKLKNTNCEHNYANWFFWLSVFFFCIFVFGGFCCVRFFGGLFWEEWKKQIQKKKGPQDANKKTT